MLYNAVVFVLVAAVAAVFGFTGVDAGLSGIGRVVCFASLAIAATVFLEIRARKGL